MRSRRSKLQPPAQLGQHPRLALAEPPAIRRKVSQHVGGKNALILDEVPEDKDRDDHGDRYDAGHQGPLPPDIGAGAKQERIDEAKDGATSNQSGAFHDA